MTRAILIAAAAVLGLAGCSRATEGVMAGNRGHYAGVGLYPAGQMWAQIAHPQVSDPAAAKLGDDEQVIVVIDSQTGEVRQCGNVSGYCIGLNPWTAPLPAGQRAPVPLVKHADQLAPDAPSAVAARKP